MSKDLRVIVQVCNAKAPRITKAGKKMTKQEIVYNRGDNESPIVFERTYFDENSPLEVGQYTAEISLFTFIEKSPEGFANQKIGATFGNFTKSVKGI